MSTLLSMKSGENHSTFLMIDEAAQTVYVNGALCSLTQQEFSLLQELAQNADRAVSRQDLLRDAWGYASPGDTRTVDVHVQRLRRKLGFSCIETVYRLGYRLRARMVC